MADPFDGRQEAVSIAVAVSALRFLYKVTLRRAWIFEEVLPAPKQPQQLPVVLSPLEVARFLGCVDDIKHHAILTTCYAAGLRISEAVHLTVDAIDSRRMSLLSDDGFLEVLCAQLLEEVEGRIFSYAAASTLWRRRSDPALATTRFG